MRIRTPAFVIVTLLFAAACGTDDPVQPGSPIVIDDEPRPPVVEPEPEPEPEEVFPYVLESVESLPLDAYAGTTREVPIRLRDSETGAVVPDEVIEFVLTGAPDEHTALLQTEATTNEAGRTSTELELGLATGQAIVMVTHPDAEPLYVNVQVGVPVEGWIRVEIREPAQPPVMLAPYRIRIFDAADLTCSTYVPRQRPPQPLAELYGPDGTQTILAEGFTGETLYTVVAEGVGNGARTLGSGCADSIQVVPGEITDTFVNIEILPINPSGTYVVNGLWDISEAMAAASSGSNMFVTVIEFMANPGQSIYDLVITEIENALGFPVGILLGYAGVQQQIVDYINGQLFQWAPLETFAAVADDLKTLLNKMQVESLLVIDKADPELRFTGHEEWTAITVNWTWRCQNNPTPNCGQHVVDLAGLDAGVASVAYGWTGYVEQYDQLQIESHQARLDVGRLQLHLLEKAILPELTGGAADTMGEALSYWVDCADLAAQALNGNDICDPSGIFCLGEFVIESACNAAMNAIGDWITDPLTDQPVLDIEIAGDARLIDGESISFANAIVEGRTDGTVQGGGEPITATWDAVRLSR